MEQAKMELRIQQERTANRETRAALGKFLGWICGLSTFVAVEFVCLSKWAAVYAYLDTFGVYGSPGRQIGALLISIVLGLLWLLTSWWLPGLVAGMAIGYLLYFTVARDR